MKTTKKPIRKRNPSFESGDISFKSRGAFLIFTDINTLISELEDLKSILRSDTTKKELRSSFKSIESQSEKILTKLASRINGD